MQLLIPELKTKVRFSFSAAPWPKEVAKRMLARLSLPVTPLQSRRLQAAPHGARIDPRATIRAALRHGGEVMALHHRKPRIRWPNLVVICDISGSMSRYSRMLLHFTHAVGHADVRVESFVFGTRLTRTTRAWRTAVVAVSCG